MRRTAKNFETMQVVAQLAGKVFAARMLAKPLRFAKETSPDNRKLLRGLSWGGQILSVGVATKRTGNARAAKFDDKTLCLRFAVRRKLAQAKLPPELRIPERIRFDHLGVTVTTDVVEHSGIAVAQGIFPGAPAAQNVGPIGTATALVRARNSAQNPIVFALGCSHVFAPPGLANPSAPIEAPPDGNASVPSNVVGGLFSFTPLQPGGANALDAALVFLSDLNLARPNLPDGSRLGPVVTRPDQLQRPVKMWRGTTGNWTNGQILALDVTKTILHPGIGGVVMTGLVESQLVNAGGDSGSPVVLDRLDQAAVSMHVGGDNVQTAWSVPLITALEHFRMDLI